MGFCLLRIGFKMKRIGLEEVQGVRDTKERPNSLYKTQMRLGITKKHIQERREQNSSSF